MVLSSTVAKRTRLHHNSIPEVVYGLFQCLCVSRRSGPSTIVCVSRRSGPSTIVCVFRRSGPSTIVCVSRRSGPSTIVCVFRRSGPSTIVDPLTLHYSGMSSL